MSSSGPPISKVPSGAQRALVVLGMHRSGTSAVAGSLHRLGVNFGPRLMPATSANERGYYEHIDIVNLHDRLLLALDSSWDETLPLPDHWWQDEARTGAYRAEMVALLRRDFSDVPFWGLKDPRLCRMLPWWQPIWRELDVKPLYLIVLRDPRAIAASLVRREGFSSAKALLLWLQHLLDAEYWTRNQFRAFLDFEEFLADPAGSLNAVSETLDCSWPSEGQHDVEAEPFLDKSLRQVPLPQDKKTIPLWVERVDQALRLSLQAGTQKSVIAAELDGVRELLKEAGNLYDPVLRQRAPDLEQHLAALRRQGQWYEQEWGKAKGREAKLQAKLSRSIEAEERLEFRIVANEEVISNMRIHNLSYLIKKACLASLTRFKKGLKTSRKE